ncbi:MAG: hypothetical protein ACXWG1_07855 [Usitatibacter sp.]
MNDLYTLVAVVLAILLELGIFYLFYFELIGNATALSAAFAVGAAAVASVMLRDSAFDDRGESTGEKSRDRTGAGV